MSKYGIEFVEHRNMAGGFYVSVFHVLTLEDDGSGQLVANHFWISVDSEWLQVWDTDINPFDCRLHNSDEVIVPVDAFELQYCYVDYVTEMMPQFSYMSYEDPLVFLDEDLEEVDSRNNLFLACWYRWKFEMNKCGFC